LFANDTNTCSFSIPRNLTRSIGSLRVVLVKINLRDCGLSHALTGARAGCRAHARSILMVLKWYQNQGIAGGVFWRRQ
jgi:hypothetical protein